MAKRDDQSGLILLIEDNRGISETVGEFLERRGYSVDYAADGITGLHIAITNSYDVIVLDLMLPGLDGIELCRKLRNEAKLSTPVLMLTARDTVEDKLVGLDAGADDYLVKPFAFAELVARIGALTRRAGGPRWAPSNDVPIVMRDDLVVESDGKSAALSPREYALLGCLVRRRGEVVTRAEILREAFGYEFDPGTNVIDVHLTHLRKKLAGFPIAIETVRGAGIRLTVTA